MKVARHGTVGLYFLIEILLLLVAIPFFFHLSFGEDVNITMLRTMVVLCVLLTITIYLYCFSKNRFKQCFALFSFNTAFLFLILGKYITNFSNDAFWGVFVFSEISHISYRNELAALTFIFLSLWCVAISYQLGSKSSKATTFANIAKENEENSRLCRIRSYCKIAMYGGAIAAFIKLFAKIVFVAQNGYLGTYLTTGAAFYENPIIDLFDKFYLLGFLGFLATFPEKKKIKFPCTLYLLYSVLSLFTGIRGEVVISILFLLWYFMKRDEKRIDQKVNISSSKIFILALLALFAFEFLLDFGSIRLGGAASQDSFVNKLRDFLDSQGGSGRLVALGLENEEKILEYISPFLIVFAPVKNFLINNSLVRLITGGVLGQTMNTLLKAPSFGLVITYVTNKSSYLNGAGLGTCYIAELAISSGAIGIILGNVVLGQLLNKIDNITASKWSGTVLLFNSFYYLVYIPRHDTLQIIPESIALVLFIFLINLFCNSNRKTRSIK